MKRYSAAILAGVIMVAYGGDVISALAETNDGVSLTVTPPLVQIEMKPGQSWASTLKVVNSNPGPLTVYPTLANFSAQGEEGYGHFGFVTSSTPPTSLAAWIDISSAPITVAPGQSGEVPFNIKVPDPAPPGGQYAAVLIGTNPPKANKEGASISISSYVSVLFFVRIAGDVRESGDMREFATDREWYDKPNVNFTLRFENTGNVHVQPRGLIAITDMWGREVASLSVNDSSDPGNVLPQSIRRFPVSWSTEKNIFRAGRYTAVATLTFGKNGQQSATRTAVFWIIPVRETAVAAGILLLMLLGLRALIWMYVRRALRGADAGMPIRSSGPRGVLDLRAGNGSGTERSSAGRWLALVLAIAAALGAAAYFLS